MCATELFTTHTSVLNRNTRVYNAFIKTTKSETQVICQKPTISESSETVATQDMTHKKQFYHCPYNVYRSCCQVVCQSLPSVEQYTVLQLATGAESHSCKEILHKYRCNSHLNLFMTVLTTLNISTGNVEKECNVPCLSYQLMNLNKMMPVKFLIFDVSAHLVSFSALILLAGKRKGLQHTKHLLQLHEKFLLVACGPICSNISTEYQLNSN